MTAFRFQYTARYGQRRSAAGGGKSEAVSRKGPGWQTQSGWEPVGPTVEMRYFAMNLMGGAEGWVCRHQRGKKKLGAVSVHGAVHKNGMRQEEWKTDSNKKEWMV